MPKKLLVLSDCGIPSGYGRIADEVLTRLNKRGYDIMAASLAYDGLLPPQLDGVRLPYWVASTPQPNFLNLFASLVAPTDPDIIMVIEDAPYVEAVRNLPLDWSRYSFIGITPVDGIPIYPNWVRTLKEADGAMSISEYGVAAYRRAGVAASLCRPGVDPNVFFQRSPEERHELRERAGLNDWNFVVGTMAQNQGRKAISAMLKAFFTFAADKPSSVYLLDMVKNSPAGWDIPALCQQYGWDESKLLYREDLERKGFVKLADRYNLLDAHMVISHREGYGLPLVEAMACGVVSIALDYTSGTEICGGGRGVLIPDIGYSEPGTWGGAEDRFPDLNALVKALDRLHSDVHYRASVAQTGMEWSRSHTWDETADQVQKQIEVVLQKRAAMEVTK